MSARLVILVVLAGGLAVYFAVRPKPMPKAQAEGEDMTIITADGQTRDDIVTKTVSEQPISGTAPADPPDLSVQVDVDTSGGRNRLLFTISEAHGWYADTFNVVAWRVGPGVDGPDDSPLSVAVHVNDFLKANETLQTCADVVPAELSRVGGQIGRTEDWGARIISHGRVREKNPDPLPRVSAAGRCRS